MNRDKNRWHRFLEATNHYLVFFLLVAFVITCCMMLFVTVLSRTLNLSLTGENLSTAAKLTFGNVLLLSLLFTVIDALRRRITVDRPVKHITEAAGRIMQGDYSVRIRPESRFATDRKYHEVIHCFNRMAEELGSVETLRTDFVAGVSHEMKTPLARIRNYAALLQEPGLDGTQRAEYAKAIADTTKRLSDMVTNILRLNRLENQNIFPAAKEYDLGEQLCRCFLGFEEQWEEKQIEVDTHIGENILIHADEELLELVWNNLFSNAIRFTPKGGSVAVSLREEDGFAIVSVRDTGCGITPEAGRHIFDKFYQADASRSGQGNGLGLALVKRVMDILRGEITVESVPGEGSCFTVRLRKQPL